VTLDRATTEYDGAGSVEAQAAIAVTDDDSPRMIRTALVTAARRGEWCP
jgi:hypothetical protein